MSATAQRLEVLFRGDGDQLNRVLPAADLHRTFVAAPDDLAVVVLLTKTLLGTLEKFVLGDASSHGGNVWEIPTEGAAPSWVVMQPWHCTNPPQNMACIHQGGARDESWARHDLHGGPDAG